VLEQIITVIHSLDGGAVRKQEGTLLVGISPSSSDIICILPAFTVLEDKVVAKQSQNWRSRFKVVGAA